MRVATIKTKSHQWSTDINGTDAEIKSYFLGQYFNVGVYPQEKMEQVISVEVK